MRQGVVHFTRSVGRPQLGPLDLPHTGFGRQGSPRGYAYLFMTLGGLHHGSVDPGFLSGRRWHNLLRVPLCVTRARPLVANSVFLKVPVLERQLSAEIGLSLFV